MYWKAGPGCIFSVHSALHRVFVFWIACSILPLISAAQNRYDVLVTEFLPDPSPPVGMPESSFIELKNQSGHDYNLHNWKISNGNSTATIKSDYLLKADSFLILCSPSDVSSFSSFGPTLGVSSFPSLNNDEGNIILSAGNGNLIHALHYEKSWFDNTVKAGGGWSLEMIDPANPCGGRENWKPSIAQTGGTPGIKNSVDAKNPDLESPSLLKVVPLDSLNLLLFFDEPLDSSSASESSNYFISDGITSPEHAAALPPFYDRIAIHLGKPIDAGKIYSVNTNQLRDCAGNTIGPRNNCNTGMPVKPGEGDVIINEILFNPPPFGTDYVELFNRSSSVISCSSLFIAGRDLYGNLKDPVGLVKEERLLFPGEYLLLTEDPAWVLFNYPQSPPSQILFLSSMPSMPDDQGKLALVNASGDLIDELDYDHHWQSPLLTSESGVSLERIHPEPPTSIASNWSSAAASAGYGTPGYKNSESFPDRLNTTELITIEPIIFSPDMDGYQDYLFIHYQLPSPGFMGSISVYDIFGRMVRRLVNNILWGASGDFRWDGLDESMNPLPMGHYILYIELFLPDGTVIKKKLVCTLARKS